MEIEVSRLEEIRVREIMTRGVATVQCEEVVPKIARIMAEENISCLVVVDRNDEAAGIVSSVDLLQVLADKTADEIGRRTAEEIMTPFVVQAHPDMTLREIANLMIADRIHRVVVLSPVGRKPVGLLSATDIVKGIGRIGGS